LAPATPSYTQYFGSTVLEAVGSQSGVTYYWQGTNSSGTSTGSPASSSFTATSAGTYYIRARSSQGCWSSSTPLTIGVEALPSFSVMGNTNLENLGDKVTFAANGSYASYQWKKDGSNVGTDPSYIARLDGNYTLSVTKSGISGIGTSSSVTVSGCGDVNPGDENYIISTTVLTENITDVNDISTLTSDDRSVNIQYVDGLGRPIQTVSMEASPDRDHLVQAIAYDEYGRQAKEYLPYVVTDNCGIFQSNPVGTTSANYTSSPQYSFYQNATDVAHDAKPYAERIFEASPLNRVLKQGAPGAAWQPVIGSSTDKVVRMQYETNASNTVRSYNVALGIPIPLSDNGYYGAGQLWKNTSEDADGNQVVEFKDKMGRIILKQVETGAGGDPWAKTHYVYDDLGNLRIVLPPEANKAIEAGDLSTVPEGYDLITEDYTVTTANYNNGSYMYVEGATVTIDPGVTLDTGAEIIPYAVSSDFLNTWAFQYKYDYRNRMVEKRVPGSGWVYMVYDKLDHLIMTQDANQRLSNEWTFTKYDKLNRPVLTGIYTHGSTIDQAAMQALANSATVFHESIGTTVLGYTNNAFPSVSSANNYLSATYYDSYSNLPSGFGLSYVQELGNGSNFSTVKGQVVGSQTKILGTTNWLKSAVYYDDRYRALQTLTTNHLGGTDRTTNVYDFSGRLLESKTTHSDGSNITEIAEEYTYDHASRLLQVDHKVNADDPVILLANEYNALGQLIDKKLYSADNGSTFEQSVDYSYNIRGWLLGINDAALADSEGDYFGMELAYNGTLSGITSGTSFNGNISAAKWSNIASGGNLQSAYAYSYDAMNRLTGADYYEKEEVWDNSTTRFDVNSLAYDLNGNILDLRRYGTSTTLAMDYMEYIYEGNRLLAVNDYGDPSQGFADGNTSGNDYVYDDNGNMISDANKDITAISYNHLNLPQLVTFTGNRSIAYTYDAAGIKLAKSVNDNGSTTVTDYVGGFIYEDGNLQQLAHAEGRVRKKDNNDFVYDYYLKDHLGNTRVTFTTENEEVIYLATMETDVNGGLDYEEFEESLFLNLPATRVVVSGSSNHSQEAGITNNEVASLNALVSTRQIGPAKLMQVMPGDTIDMEVFAYYPDSYSDNGSISNTNVLSTLISTISGVAPAGSETAAITSSINGNAGSIFVGSSGSSSAPRAFLNYILFDRNFGYLDAGYVQISSSAGSAYEELNLLKTIEEAGFIYVYVSNESNVSHNVYFDDLRITHIKGRIIQEDHYYPFGLSIAALSSTAPLSKPNNFKYNGFEEQTDFDLRWYDYQARFYDPQLGRFMQVDPAADLMRRHSPYNYAYDNPIRFIDPDGMMASDVVRNGCPPDDPDCQGNQEEDPNEVSQDEQESSLYLPLVLLAAYEGTGAGAAAAAAASKGGKFSIFALLFLVSGDTPIAKYSEEDDMQEYADLQSKGYSNLSEKEKKRLNELRIRFTFDKNGNVIGWPSYENPGTHDPGSGRLQYDQNKSVIPSNHWDLWNSSIPDPNSSKTRWAAEGSGKNTVFHRFQSQDPDGKWGFHWNGSTKAFTQSGQERSIPESKVPNSVKRELEKMLKNK